MQLHQIELVPGESIRVGYLIVTLVSVEGNIAQLQVEDPDDNSSWMDPVHSPGCEVGDALLV